MFNFSDQVLYGAELGNTWRWFRGVFYCALCGMKQKEALVLARWHARDFGSSPFSEMLQQEILRKVLLRDFLFSR